MIITSNPDNQIYFAAVMLIFGLYKQGLLPSYIFKNILKDCQNYVDVQAFPCYDLDNDIAILGNKGGIEHGS